MTISELIGGFVEGCDLESLGDGVADYAKLMIADSLGVALAGANSEESVTARKAILALAEGGNEARGSTLIGALGRVSSRDAALVNGVSMDALGMDDTFLEGGNHPSASVLPAVFAVAETLQSSGRAMLEAYVAGIEVAARVGSAARLGVLKKGFSTSSIAGSFGAAVAAGKLLGLNEEGLREAQGFAGEIAAGNMLFLDSGTWTKNINKGWPAACGVTAAYFAKSGFKSPPDIYEGRFGIFTLHTDPGHEFDLTRCVEGIGEKWRIFEVLGKRYPTCHFLDSFVRAAIQLREQLTTTSARIVNIECLVPEGAVAICCEPAALRRRSQTMVDANGSIYYNVALALLGHGVTLASQEKFMHDAEVLDFSDLVTYVIAPNSGSSGVFTSKITANLDDGTSLSVEQGSGPLSPTEYEEKFIEFVSPVVGPARAREAWTTLMDVENVNDVREIGALFAL